MAADEPAATGNGRRIVDLRFKPMWAYVDAIREFCGFFTKTTFDDPQLGERLALVVHELVENGIRHADQDNAEAELELNVARMPDAVQVSVTNSTRPEQAHKLHKVFRELQQMSPEEAYSQALQRSAGLPQGESGLGLPRIRLEGGVELDVDVEDDRVRVHARGDL